MFTEKVVQILDSSKLIPGHIITIANMKSDYNDGGGLFFYEGKRFNALIKSCYETDFVIVTHEREMKRIGIVELFKDDERDGEYTKYKIIAVSEGLK